MRESVKEGDPRGRSVGGGGDSVAREWKGLDIHGKRNKAKAFYMKKRGDCLFLPQQIPLQAECHVLLRSAGNERLSLGHSTSQGAKVLAS